MSPKWAFANSWCKLLQAGQNANTCYKPRNALKKHSWVSLFHGCCRLLTKKLMWTLTTRGLTVAGVDRRWHTAWAPLWHTPARYSALKVWKKIMALKKSSNFGSYLLKLHELCKIKPLSLIQFARTTNKLLWPMFTSGLHNGPNRYSLSSAQLTLPTPKVR